MDNVAQFPAGISILLAQISFGINRMDAARKERAYQLLSAASRDASHAVNLARQGRNGEALKAWRALFGPKFPLS